MFNLPALLLFLFCLITSCNYGRKNTTPAPSPVSQSSSEKKKSDQLTVCSEDYVKFLIGVQFLPQYTLEGRRFGYQLAEIKPGHFFEKIGLINYDIILRINDLPTDSPTAFLFDGLLGLKPGGIHSFLVRRSNKLLTIKKPCPK